VNWPVAVNRQSLDHAVTLLRSGGVVAFPTETYYGLAVDPFNSRALERLFRVKQRPSKLPILVLVAGMDHLPLLTRKVPAIYHQLIDCFWPGPLTLVCPALPSLPSQLTGNTGTIAIRQSPHATANALIATFDGPITATSANITGFPAAVSAVDVARMFDTEIDLILDGGTTPGGRGSTLIGIDKDALFCIREGKIGFSAVQNCATALALND
jgi:L-threonylcarbamoyladenylate synthase